MKPEHQVGEHYLVELNGCETSAINSESILRVGMLEAVEKSGARIIKDVFHSFSPHGVTGVVVIAESHVSIHTWPELAYAAVDIFTCSSAMNVDHVIKHLSEITGAAEISIRKISRGPFAKNVSLALPLS